MKTNNYALKLNGTTVFVKGYSASVRMHVETPNAPVPSYHQQITPNHSSHKSLVMNSCKGTASSETRLVEIDKATIH